MTREAVFHCYAAETYHKDYKIAYEYETRKNF